MTDLNNLNQYKLVAGTDSLATDVFDSLYDFSALPAGPQGSAAQTTLTTQAYFYHPDYFATLQLLQQDIRSNDFTQPKVWQLTVSSDQVGPFQWDWTYQRKSGCQKYSTTLKDLSDGRLVDLSTTSFFQFTQNGATRAFELKATAIGVPSQVNRPLSLWSPRQGSGSAFLSWLSGGSGTAYRLYRSETSGRGYAPVTNSPIQETYFVDRGLSSGKTYYYVVTAMNGDECESGYSDEATVPLP